MKKTYSFDIFDTCFVRSCGFPHNVFDILAIRILGNNCSPSIKADFVNIRLQAEEKARKIKSKEITLSDIYNLCDFSGISNYPKDYIQNKEIEVEQEVLVPVYSISEQITKLHQKGHNIYYISDMYLPESFIKELLQAHGFWEKGDKLYVSCTSGKTKHDGTLFDLIAKENNIKFKNWYHWGDNKYSDYYIPRKKGIQAQLINHKFSHYEKYILNDYFIAEGFEHQRLAGIQKAIRLSQPATPQNILACDIIIPLLTSFVYNILEDAQKKGIHKLFFLARDGYILYYIAKLISQDYPYINISYFYTSRSALYFPGLSKLTEKNFLKLLGKLSGEIIYEKLINKANIDITSFTSDKSYYIPIQNEEDGEKLVINLYRNHKFTEYLQNEHLRQKKLVLEYFKQEGLSSKTTSTAIVDIRGTRSCHEAINNILRESGYPPTFGYYWEVIKSRKNINNAGNYYADIFGERYADGNTFLKNIEGIGGLIEQYFCASGQARTIQYANKGNKIIPIFEKKSISEYGKQLCITHQLIASQYITHYKRNNLDINHKNIYSLNLRNLLQFSYLPTKSDLEAIRYTLMNDNQFHYLYIIQKHSIIDLVKRNFKDNEWGRGSLAYNFYLFGGERLGRWLLKCLFTLKSITQ